MTRRRQVRDIGVAMACASGRVRAVGATCARVAMTYVSLWGLEATAAMRYDSGVMTCVSRYDAAARA